MTEEVRFNREWRTTSTITKNPRKSPLDLQKDYPERKLFIPSTPIGRNLKYISDIDHIDTLLFGPKIRVSNNTNPNYVAIKDPSDDTKTIVVDANDPKLTIDERKKILASAVKFSSTNTADIKTVVDTSLALLQAGVSISAADKIDIANTIVASLNSVQAVAAVEADLPTYEKVLQVATTVGISTDWRRNRFPSRFITKSELSQNLGSYVLYLMVRAESKEAKGVNRNGPVVGTSNKPITLMSTITAINNIPKIKNTNDINFKLVKVLDLEYSRLYNLPDVLKIIDADPTNKINGMDLIGFINKNNISVDQAKALGVNITTGLAQLGFGYR